MGSTHIWVLKVAYISILNPNLVNEAIHIPQVVSCILHVDQLEKKIWLVTWLWVIVVRTYPRLVSPQETNAGTVRTS